MPIGCCYFQSGYAIYFYTLTHCSDVNNNQGNDATEQVQKVQTGYDVQKRLTRVAVYTHGLQIIKHLPIDSNGL